MNKYLSNRKRTITYNGGVDIGGPVKAVHKKNGAIIANLKTGQTGGTFEVNTGIGSDVIAVGNNNEIQIVDESDPANNVTATPANFEIVDAHVYDYGPTQWDADNCFFAACSLVYLEDTGGSTPSLLHQQDPADGVVGRVENRLPSGATDKGHILSQSVTSKKLLFKLDSSGRLIIDNAKQTGKSIEFKNSTPIINTSHLHLIFTIKCSPSTSNALYQTEMLGNKIRFALSATSNDVTAYIGVESLLLTGMRPVLTDGNFHVFEFIVSSDTGTHGFSKIRIDNNEFVFSTVNSVVSEIAAGSHSVLKGGPGYSAGFNTMSLSQHEMTGTEYTNAIDSHKQHAGIV